MKQLTLTHEQARDLMDKGLLIQSFQDSHMHLVSYGHMLSLVDLRGSSSIDEMIDRLTPVSQKKVEAFGWNQETFIEKRYPTRYDLDRIASDRPVMLSRICGHITAVNSFVIEQLGLDKQVIAIEGGVIDRDEGGKATGILREKARELLYKQGYYDGSLEDVKRYILVAQEDLISRGVTSVHSDDFTCFPNLHWRDILGVFEGMVEDGSLHLHVVEQAQGNPEELAVESRRLEGKQFEIGSLKLFTDGSLGSRTAHLQEPYSDEPSTCGIAIQSDSDLFDQVRRAYEVKLPCSIHAIGDQAIHRVLTAFEQLNAPKAYLCLCGIIHCQITNESLVHRMASLGIRAYIQPLFIHEDAKVVYERLGAKRANTSYIWKTMLLKGIPLWLGSDAPIEVPDVFKGIYSAVTRRTLDANPITYLPEEGLSLEESLEGYRKEKTTKMSWILLNKPIIHLMENPEDVSVEGIWRI